MALGGPDTGGDYAGPQWRNDRERADAEAGYGQLLRLVASTLDESDPGASQALRRAADDVEEMVRRIRALESLLAERAPADSEVFECPDCRAQQPEPGRCGRCPGTVRRVPADTDTAPVGDLWREDWKRIAEHLAYCPHSTPEDERAGLVIQGALATLSRRPAADELTEAELASALTAVELLLEVGMGEDDPYDRDEFESLETRLRALLNADRRPVSRDEGGSMSGSVADPITKLADAVNQIAMVVEEIGWYASQSGYTDVTVPRRRRWQSTLREQREIVATLIPDGEDETSDAHG